MRRPVIILGGGGHAKVAIGALLAAGVPILGIADPDPSLTGRTVLGVPFLGDDEAVLAHPPGTVELVVGLGSTGLPEKRASLFEAFKKRGYSFASVISPSAVVGVEVVLLEGAQVMAGAVIQPGTTIGRNAIVNTRASVDHDCVIGAHTHIAPGVTLSGFVHVGEGSLIGTGASVIQGIHIGKGCLVGAGSVVLQDLPDGTKAWGVPAREASR